MNKKLEGPFKELPYKRVLNDLAYISQNYPDDNREIRKVKKSLENRYGAVQMQVFYDSLPKKATPYLKKGENPSTTLFYALPISASEQMLNSGNKTKLTGNNKGGLVDYRKTGMFKK